MVGNHTETDLSGCGLVIFDVLVHTNQRICRSLNLRGSEGCPAWDGLRDVKVAYVVQTNLAEQSLQSCTHNHLGGLVGAAVTKQTPGHHDTLGFMRPGADLFAKKIINASNNIPVILVVGLAVFLS